MTPSESPHWKIGRGFIWMLTVINWLQGSLLAARANTYGGNPVNKISGYNALSVQVQSTEIPIGRLYKQAVMTRLNAPGS